MSLVPNVVAARRRRRNPRLHASLRLRDYSVLRSLLPADIGGEGLNVAQAAAKHKVTRRVVYAILQKDHIAPIWNKINRDVRETIENAHKEWTEKVFARHREMGDDALDSTRALIQKQEPRTVSDYWHRMGITIEPQADVNVQTLQINAPPALLAAIREVAGVKAEDGLDALGKKGCSASEPDAEERQI